MMRNTIFVIIIYCATCVSATEQISDILKTAEGDREILERPLTSYLQERDMLSFSYTETTNYKGYIANWAIDNSRLYLTYFQGYYAEHKTLDMVNVFGRRVENQKVFASWYSGVITIPVGELIGHDSNYTPIYSEAIVYFVEQGIIINKYKSKYILLN